MPNDQSCEHLQMLKQNCSRKECLSSLSSCKKQVTTNIRQSKGVQPCMQKKKVAIETESEPPPKLPPQEGMTVCTLNAELISQLLHESTYSSENGLCELDEITTVTFEQ